MRHARRLAPLLAALVLLAPLGLAGPSSAASAPQGTAGPAGKLYVPEVDANDIAVVDTATNAIVRRIPVTGLASRPAVLAATPDGRKIYVDNFGLVPATVSVIDTRTNTTKTIYVASTPLGAFTSNDGKQIFLPEVGFTVEVLDVATDRIVHRFHYADIPVGAIQGPDGLLYIAFATGQIGAYDPTTGRQIKAPIWSGGLAPFWYTFDPAHHALYVDSINSIGIVDLDQWRLTKTVNTGPSSQYSPTDPGAFTSTLSPDGSKLYVALFGDKDVLIMSTATDTIIGRIPTAGATTGVTFSADGTRGYISDLGKGSALPTPLGELVIFGDLVTLGLLPPGQVDVFDPRTDQPVGKPIPTRAGPGISAWLPNS